MLSAKIFDEKQPKSSKKRPRNTKTKQKTIKIN